MSQPRKKPRRMDTLDELDPFDRRYVRSIESWAVAMQEIAKAMPTIATAIEHVATAIDRGTTQLAVGMWHGRGLSPGDASGQAVEDREQAQREVDERQRK